jgi:hypothetical protein
MTTDPQPWVAMSSVVNVVIVLAACLSVFMGLRFPVDIHPGPLITFGPSGKPTAGRLLAVAFLAAGGAFGFYAMARVYDWGQVLFLVPLFYFVLIFHVASNRFIQRFLVKPFAVYAVAFCAVGVGLVAGPGLWQALTTGTVQGRFGGQPSVDQDPFLFWWNVFARCAWIWFTLALTKTLLIRHRRGWPLSRYLPGDQ